MSTGAHLAGRRKLRFLSASPRSKRQIAWPTSTASLEISYEGKNKSRESTPAGNGAIFYEKQKDIGVRRQPQRRSAAWKKAEICNQEWNKTAAIFDFEKIQFWNVLQFRLRVNLEIFIADFFNFWTIWSCTPLQKVSMFRLFIFWFLSRLLFLPSSS